MRRHAIHVLGTGALLLALAFGCEAGTSFQAPGDPPGGLLPVDDPSGTLDAEANIHPDCLASTEGCVTRRFYVEKSVDGEVWEPITDARLALRDENMDVVATSLTNFDGAIDLVVPGGYYFGELWFGGCLGPDGDCLHKVFPYQTDIDAFRMASVAVTLGGTICPINDPGCWDVWLERVIKPNIYLYPEETTEVSVRLVPMEPGALTVTDPEYGEGWDVEVTPEGIIEDEYTFLFYESDVPALYQTEFGYVVPYEDRLAWMEDTLPLYGLEGAEVDDFIDYWTIHLPEMPYYFFFPQNSARCDELVALEVDPEPDNVLRIWFYVVGAYGPFRLPEPPPPRHFEREGFVVTEWGIMVSDLSFGL